MDLYPSSDLEKGELLQKYEVSVGVGPVPVWTCTGSCAPAGLQKVRPALVGVGLYQGQPLQTRLSRCRWLLGGLSLGDLRVSAVC